MNKADIFNVLLEWNFWRKDIQTGIKRKELTDKLDKLTAVGEVTLISGVRRCGKSTLLLQFAKQLINNGTPKEDILYINFDEPKFSKPDLSLMNDIYDVYREHLLPQGKPFVFLDEVQRVKEWERFAKALHDRKEANVIASGSNAQLLSKEFGTLLTGRHLDLTAYPLSFKEFLAFKNTSIDNELDLASNRFVVKNLLNEYLENGALPKVVLEQSQENKVSLLKTYFEDILTRDVIERYKINEIDKLKAVAIYYITNTANPHSATSISKFIELSPDTINRFSSYLNSAYMLFFVPKYSRSLKEQAVNPKKVYCIDTGLKNAVGFRTRDDFGKLMENAIFIELKRRNKEVYYWRDRYGYEVDFIIKEGLAPNELIQACWDLSDEKVKQREIRALMHAMKEFNLKTATVITEDMEAVEKYGDNIVQFIPITKWLLQLN